MENILFYSTVEGGEEISVRRTVVVGAWVLSHCLSGRWAAILTLQRHQNTGNVVDVVYVEKPWFHLRPTYRIRAF